MTSPFILKTCVNVLSVTGMAQLGASRFQGLGAIMCLHQVLPGGGQAAGFAPNHQLELDTEFLDQSLTSLKAIGFRFVSLDAAVDEILSGKKRETPFLAFTLDDGYRDNLLCAAPVFRRHGCPYAIFVAPRIADGTCELWWKLLEQIVARADQLSLTLGGEMFDRPNTSVRDKQKTYQLLFAHLKAMDEYAQRKWIRAACAAQHVDVDGTCRELAMNWDELRAISRDPLCTIGAHTLNHYALAKLSVDDCKRELLLSRSRIKDELKTEVRYFAFPYGDEPAAGPKDFSLAAAAGFRASLTTRKGMIFPEHASHMQALPRVMMSGRYQDSRFLNTLLTGTPFALLNRFRKINVE